MDPTENATFEELDASAQEEKELREKGLQHLQHGEMLLGLNCMFPGLNLQPSANNRRLPNLDKNFSLFSESPEDLKRAFASAGKYHAEQLRLLNKIKRKAEANKIPKPPPPRQETGKNVKAVKTETRPSYASHLQPTANKKKNKGGPSKPAAPEKGPEVVPVTQKPIWRVFKNSSSR